MMSIITINSPRITQGVTDPGPDPVSGPEPDDGPDLDDGLELEPEVGFKAFDPVIILGVFLDIDPMTDDYNMGKDIS